jgi:FxsC-like protein
MPFFFLSYANADGDGHMNAFYKDLCEAVRARTGLPQDEIGFRDQSAMALGVNWRTGLETALATTQVFIALCSPSYFASDMCGREWQMFSELAQRRQRQRSGGSPLTSLLPIVWTPAATMPAVARRLQYVHEDLGNIYRDEGLHFLKRLRRYQDEYELFVVRLAERVVAAGRSNVSPVTMDVPQLADVSNPFVAEAAANTSGRVVVPSSGRNADAPRPAHPAMGTVPGGPRHVHFVVVAPPTNEVGGLRRDAQFYGPTPLDWAPYRPQYPRRVCIFAQNVASTNDMTSALATGDTSIVGLVTQAKERNELVMLLVDVWATKLDPYHAVLLEYDNLNAPTSAVMVPWNETDEEIRERADELLDDLRLAFPNNVAREDEVFRTALATHETLQIAMEEALVLMQARITRLGTVLRRAGGARTIERPVLSSPEEGASR